MPKSSSVSTRTPPSSRRSCVLLLSLQVVAEHRYGLDHVRAVRDLVLQVQEGLMVRFVHLCHESVSLVEVASVEALPHPLEIVGVLIALDNLHLDQRHFVAGGLVELAQQARYFTREVAEVRSLVAGVLAVLLGGGSPGCWRSRSVSESRCAGAVHGFAHFVFAQICLYAL